MIILQELEIEEHHINFRVYADKLSFMLAYESARELSAKNKNIKTPLSGFERERNFR